MEYFICRYCLFEDGSTLATLDHKLSLLIHWKLKMHYLTDIRIFGSIAFYCLETRNINLIFGFSPVLFSIKGFLYKIHQILFSKSLSQSWTYLAQSQTEVLRQLDRNDGKVGPKWYRTQTQLKQGACGGSTKCCTEGVYIAQNSIKILRLCIVLHVLSTHRFSQKCNFPL